jgi:hypothetical protein
MKKMLFILVVFLVFSCGNKTSSTNFKNSKTTQPETNGLAEFEFTKEIHNFGSLQSGEIVVYTFEFKNTGNNNLIINNIETGCGCIKADFSKKTVLPGERGFIDVEFDSSGLWGKQFKTIEVYANTKKTKQLAIFAKIQNEQLEIKY